MNARSAQLITYGLAAACGVLGLAAILAWMGAGRGYSWANESGEAPPVTGVGRVDAESVAMPPEAQFAEIQQRPIFNEDRKPTPPAPPDKKPEDNLPPVPLNITLTGIVLTPNVRLAMVQDNAKNEAVSLRIGMPLPGDQQVWTLTEIRNRSVVFKNASDETAEVELQVAAVAAMPPPQPRLAPPPPPPGQPTAASPAAAPATNVNAPAQPGADRAAELQRRIEERRREMREQAEKLRQQQEPNKNTE